MISTERLARMLVENAERLYEISLHNSETARQVRERMEYYSVGDVVLIYMTRCGTPAIRRVGELLRDELLECQEQDDEELRGPNWKPTTERTWTIRGLDGEEYMWYDVRVLRIPS